MVLTPSIMQELGLLAPDFSLPDTTGKTFTLSEQPLTKGLLLVFMCNHCPYVIHIREKLVEKIRTYQQQGITVVAINANDWTTYTDDSPEKMAADSKQFDYSFPYLIDESQKVAQAYGAACTPDFFLFDGDKKLVYRGQFDDARPGKDVVVTGNDLSAAIDALLAGTPVTQTQKPSMGCNIKWREGNAPDYFPA